MSEKSEIGLWCYLYLFRSLWVFDCFCCLSCFLPQALGPKELPGSIIGIGLGHKVYLVLWVLGGYGNLYPGWQVPSRICIVWSFIVGAEWACRILQGDDLLECVQLAGCSVKHVSSSSREEVQNGRLNNGKAFKRHHNKAITIWVRRETAWGCRCCNTMVQVS
jgi:hypothetical protein